MADSKAENRSTVISDAAFQKIQYMKLKHEDFKSIKLKALNSKKHTDCSFLVGEEGTELEEFHGIKSDLMIVSGFMEGLFSSPLCPEFPIRIKNIQPNTFGMIMEFAHLGEIVRKCDALEATELAIAADHLLIDSLKPICFELISLEVTSAQVWTVLDLLIKFGLSDLAPSCHELLSSNTEPCMQEETFLTANVESVQEFLTLEQMFISSEKLLVEYCNKWALNTIDPRESMRSLLPGFRLLTLKPSEATRLSHFLTRTEEVHLLRYFITGETESMPATLCSHIENRQSAGIVKQVILDHVLRRASIESVWVPSGRSLLNVTTNQNILLTKLTLVIGKSRRTDFICQYSSNNRGWLTIETDTLADKGPVCELKFVIPFLLGKGVAVSILCASKNSNETFPVVPSPVLDLNSCGAATRAHFQQLQIAKSDLSIIHSFTYRIVSA